MDYHSYGEEIRHPAKDSSDISNTDSGRILFPNDEATTLRSVDKLRELASIAAEAIKNASNKERIYQVITSEELSRLPAVVGNK